MTFQKEVGTIVKMRIFHTSDVHIESSHPERFDALLTTVDKAKEAKADYLVIAGDLFDDFESAMENAVKLRGVFSGLPFKVIIAPGNHDFLIFDSSRDFGEDSIVLYEDSNVYEDREMGVRFSTVPYSTKLPPSAFMEKLSRLAGRLSPNLFNIFIFHGDLEEIVQKVGFRRAIAGEEKEGAFSLSLNALKRFPNIKLVLAGHYHNAGEPMPISEIRGNQFFVYSGSPVSVTKNDSGPRNIMNVEISEDFARVSLSRILLDSFYYEKLSIYLKGTESDPLEEIKKRVDDALLRGPSSQILLNISGYVNSAISLPEAQLKDKLMELSQQVWKERVVLYQEWYQVQDVSSLLERSYSRNIIERIDSSSELSDQEKIKVKDWFIGALGKVYSSRKGKL